VGGASWAPHGSTPATLQLDEVAPLAHHAEVAFRGAQISGGVRDLLVKDILAGRQRSKEKLEGAGRLGAIEAPLGARVEVRRIESDREEAVPDIRPDTHDGADVLPTQKHNWPHIDGQIAAM
jgi:hypothetical protein